MPEFGKRWEQREQDSLCRCLRPSARNAGLGAPRGVPKARGHRWPGTRGGRGGSGRTPGLPVRVGPAWARAAPTPLPVPVQLGSSLNLGSSSVRRRERAEVPEQTARCEPPARPPAHPVCGRRDAAQPGRDQREAGSLAWGGLFHHLSPLLEPRGLRPEVENRPQHAAWARPRPRLRSHGQAPGGGSLPPLCPAPTAGAESKAALCPLPLGPQAAAARQVLSDGRLLEG